MRTYVGRVVKKGWFDVGLIERTELTAGSASHVVGLLPLFNMRYTEGQSHNCSVDLYKGLPAVTGQSVSFHVIRNMRLVANQERMDQYSKCCSVANTIGVSFRIICPAEIKALWPLIVLDHGFNSLKVIGAHYNPEVSHNAPVDLTTALRKGSRAGRVEKLPSAKWKVLTYKGDITCEHLVCAAGNYARETGRMFGAYVPAIPVEHQYIVYAVSSELSAHRDQGGHELAVLREFDGAYYLREERMGWIHGPTRKARLRARPMACPTGLAEACLRVTWIGCCCTSKQPLSGCRPKCTVTSTPS